MTIQIHKVQFGTDDEQVKEQMVGIIRDRLGDEQGEEFREHLHDQAVILIQSGLFSAGIQKLQLILAADPGDEAAAETVVQATEMLQ